MLRKITTILIFGILLISCKKQKGSMTIYFTGDILLDRGFRKIVEYKGTAGMAGNCSQIFRNADFVIGNLECPATKRKEPVNKRFVFRAEPEWLKIVADAGFTHLVMANNHAYDQGSDGMKDTYKNMLKYKMVPVGYGLNAQKACEPVILTKGKTRVALFSSVPIALENWFPNEDSVNICQECISTLTEKVASYHKINPGTHIIVILHWGMEFQYSPLIIQKMEARSLLNAGAEVIIGHHPHVVQDIDHFGDKTVFYSLGNFIFDQTAQGSKGMVVKLEISEQEIKTRTYYVKIMDCSPVIQF